MKFAQFFILIIAFFIFQRANAGVLIEPVLGYSMGSFEGEVTESEKLSGPSFGGRLGYQKLGFQLGLDYLNSNLDVDNKEYSSLKTSEWAGFIGFEFPILVRLYAGYIFSATGSTKFEGGDLDLQKGSGTKFGIGFTGLPFVDINFEYRTSTFDEIKFDGEKSDISTDFNTYMISFSLPFVL